MKYLKYLVAVLFLPITAQATEKLECKSFDGNWSKASVERLENGSYKLEIKFWGQKSKVYLGDMDFVKYRDRAEFDDSPYEEVYYSFKSEKLKGLEVDYVQTSDGDDLLYLKSSKISSSLSCK